MPRVLRHRRREAVAAVGWVAVFASLLVLRVLAQRTAPDPGPALDWLRLGAVAMGALLVGAAALGSRAPLVGRVVLWVEQAAVFVAITRLLGLGALPDPGRPERVLIALLGVHAIGAIVVSEELPAGTASWRAGLWCLAASFGALTASVLTR